MELQIKINDCYGIGKLDCNLIFNDRPIIIRAPNGTFKTSFCKTLSDYAQGINDSTFGKTLKQFKTIYPSKTNAIKILDIIGILTPMEIHVNGFAYEPLIDYSISRLRSLFNELVLILPNSLK